MLIFGTENALLNRIMIGHKYLLLTDLSDEFSELYQIVMCSGKMEPNKQYHFRTLNIQGV